MVDFHKQKRWYNCLYTQMHCPGNELLGLPVAPEAQASRFETQAQIINENKNCTLLIIGDMDATTSAHDRTSTNKYIADKMYQDFIKDHNLSPLPHHSPVDTNLPEPRPWTFSRPTGKDSVGNTTYSFSHTDDIVLPTALANTCKPSYTCDLGYLSDHVPLLTIVPTCTLNL